MYQAAAARMIREAATARAEADAAAEEEALWEKAARRGLSVSEDHTVPALPLPPVPSPH